MQSFISTAVTAHGQALSSLPTYTLSYVLSMSNSASLHVNVEYALVYILSLVGRAYIWAAVLRKGNRGMRSEVAPYSKALHANAKTRYGRHIWRARLLQENQITYMSLREGVLIWEFELRIILFASKTNDRPCRGH